jgi:hypothetical protein
MSREFLKDAEPEKPNALIICKWYQTPAFRLPGLLVDGTAFLEHDSLNVIWAYGCPEKKMLLNIRDSQ